MTRPGNDSAAAPAEREAAHPLDTTIRRLVFAMLIFMPAAFGAVDGWSESVIVAGAGAIALCLAIRGVVRRGGDEGRAIWTWAYVPLALFALLVTAQLLPLPPALVKLISSNTWEIKMRLLADVPDAPKWMTLSFYPLATRQMLRVILVATTMFAAVVQVFERSAQIKQLLTFMAMLGAGAAVLALAQDLTGARAVYWLVRRAADTGDYLATAGPLVNYNNYAQFANLALGAALGLLLARLTEATQNTQKNPPAWSSAALLTDEARAERRRLGWLIAAILLITISVFLSRSRGGMIALLIGAVVTGLACAASPKLAGRGWVPLALALAVLVALLYVGLSATLDRLGTLWQAPRVAAKARVEVARDVWHQLIPRFPVLGTGLGTHEVVYPMISRQTFYGLAGNVENEYVQVLEETGGVGLALLLAFGAVIAASWLHAVRRLAHRPIRAAAFGLGFGLIAVLVHSTSDFGQRVPAVACMTAVSCALLVNLSRSVRPRNETSTTAATIIPARSRWPLALAGPIVVLIVFGWATSGAVRCALGQWQWDKALAQEAELAADHWQGPDAPFADLITHAAKAAAWEPDNVTYRHWLNVYRWYSIARVDPEAGRVLVDDQARDFARRIVAELHRARTLCPTFGPPLSIAGQIELFFLHDPAGEQHIEAGYELARCHPQSCLIAGALDARRGRWDAAQEKLRRALALGQPLEDVLTLYLRPEIDRPDLAMEIVGGNVWGLTRLSELLAESHRHGEIASVARAQAAATIKSQAADPSASPYDLASAAQLLAEEKDFDTAAGYYRRALTTEYGHAEWHLSLAQTLARAGKREEAMREARVCLRLRPETRGARELIEQLSVEPARTAAAKKGPG